MPDNDKPTPPGGKASASWLSAENAYRKRKGLPLLNPADYGLEGPAPEAPAPPAAAPQEPAAPAAAPPQAAAASGPVAAGAVASGNKVPPPPGGKWSSSRLASENAYRKKKGIPLLTAADVGLEEAAPAAAAPAPPTAAPAAAAPPTAAVPPAAAPVAQKSPAAMAAALRGATANKYVGTPAVGTSQAAAAGGVAATGPWDTPNDQSRRRFAWIGIIGFLTVWLVAFFRFFLPRTLFEPSSVFRIGLPSDFGLGVDTKFQQQFRIWVTRTPERLFVIYARCTHLGCTPDWKESENKFKCPCHGSGFDSEGINFEGPAPRPLDRAHVQLDPEGQIVVDVSRLYAWVKGQKNEFDETGAYLQV